MVDKDDQKCRIARAESLHQAGIGTNLLVERSAQG